MSSLSPTADRLARDRERQVKQAQRDQVAGYVAYWEGELANRRAIHAEVSAVVQRAFAEMLSDNGRYGHDSFVNQADPSTMTAAKHRWATARKEQETSEITMNTAERHYLASCQRLEQLDAALAD